MHFRELKPESDPQPQHSPCCRASPGPLRYGRLLLEAGVEPDAQAAPHGDGLSVPAHPGRALLERDPEAHQRVIEELAYLSNVLIAGDPSAEAGRGDPWKRPSGFWSSATRACGPSWIVPARDRATPREALVRWGAVGAFRFAWASRGGPERC